MWRVKKKRSGGRDAEIARIYFIETPPDGVCGVQLFCVCQEGS